MPSPTDKGFTLELPPELAPATLFKEAPAGLLWLAGGLSLALIALLAYRFAWPLLQKYLESRAKTPDELELKADLLRKSWQRFVRKVPRADQFSLAQFEHVVVSGAARSGKRELIDNYSDYRRQSQYFPSQTDSSALQVYAGSGVLITELPASLLSENGLRVQAALTQLWKPLYKERLPVFVVVVDLIALSAMSEQQLLLQAQQLRGQINALSDVGEQRVRVRVVGTRLEHIEGWTELAKLFEAEGMPLHVGLRDTTSRAGMHDEFYAWIASLREQLPRALVTLSADSFQKVVRFLRTAEMDASLPLFENLALYMNALFQQDALSRDPVCEGVYLAAATPGSLNPLRNPDARGQLRSPVTRYVLHAVGSFVLAAALVIVAKYMQRATLEAGETATNSLFPSGGKFTWDGAQLQVNDDLDDALDEPWFELWSARRKTFRKTFSDSAREALKERLLDVNQAPAVLGMAWLRIATYLALIHGDHSDYFELLRPDSSSMTIWRVATGLDERFIRAYLSATEEAHKSPVGVDRHSFKLDELDTDAMQKSSWYEVVEDALAALSRGSIDPQQLVDLGRRAQAVRSFRGDPNDERVALEIFSSLDAAVAYGKKTGVEQESTDLCGHFDPAEGEGNSPVTGSPGDRTLRDSYAEIFHSRRGSSRYYRLCKQHRAVMTVLDEVANSTLPQGGLVTLSALNDALEQLAPRDSANGKDKSDADTGVAVRLLANGDRTFPRHRFDPLAWRALTRQAQVQHLVDSLVGDHGPGQGFAFAQPSAGAPVAWNTSLSGAGPFVGTATIAPSYARAYYDRFVRGELDRFARMLARLDVQLSPELQQSFESFMTAQVTKYALAYATQLRAFARDFDLGVIPSQAGLRALLGQLAAEASPFSHYVGIVADQASANSDGPLFVGMRDALSEFASWRAMPGSEEGGGELEKYRALLAQLLLDLGPDKEAAPAPADADESTATLESELSPLGRIALTELLDKKDAYGHLVEQWLDAAHLEGNEQRRPFRAPIALLRQAGAVEIKQAVTSAWNRELRPSLAQLSTKFPFDPNAPDDVTPEELAAELDPVNGRFFSGVRSYIEPISTLAGGRPFALHPSLRGFVSPPEEMYPTINALAALSARLFDATGKSKPLAIAVRTVPLARGEDPDNALTAAFVGVDTTSLYAFNQRTTDGSLPIDWTREQIAQVGGQYTNLASRRTVFAEPVASASSYWSLLRLLRLAEVDGQSSQVGGTTYTWRIAGPDSASKTSQVRFRVVGNPWKYFALPLANAGMRASGT